MWRNYEWDPMQRKGVDVPTYTCSTRVKSDVKMLVTDRPYGVYVVPDDEDILNLHALILGPSGSPYEKGFFYFYLRIPPDFPWYPPRVKLMTTGGGSVRFNPNLYKDGKVCLSILGTWPGPEWTPALTLSSVLISIQSLMNEYPFYNEPGFEMTARRADALQYNQMILHETLRVAVVGMLRNDTGLAIPDMFVHLMREKFWQNFSYYDRICHENMHLNNKLMLNALEPHNNKCFDYARIRVDLQNLKAQLASSKTG